MDEEVAVNEQATLSDTLRASFDEHIPTETPEPAPVPAAAPGGETQPATATPAADERPRGPDGKFVEKKAEPTAATATASTQTKPTGSAATPAPAVGTPAPLARPSSWKKELEPQWAALPPDVQKYVLQREGEFAKGVSTYKTEWDNARPLIEAMRPFAPLLQQHGIKADQWISSLGNAHVALAQGSPEQKLSMFLKLAQDYQVPVQNLFQQGQDGKVYFNPQVQPHQAPAPQARAPQAQDVERIIEQKFAQQAAVQSLAQFEAEAPQKYPHYETVKADMARLLEAGFARDYPSAYQAAVRLPEHSEIFDAIQEQERAAKVAETQKAQAEAAQRARRNTVSPRTATPATTAKTNGKKDLRGTLEDAFEEHAGAGRV